MEINILFHKPISSDSQQLPLCVSYPSHSIACAAIYLSAMYLRVSLCISRTLEIPLPALNWWELFDTSLEIIQQITREMFKLYERKRIEWLDEAEHRGLSNLTSTADALIMVDGAVAQPVVMYPYRAPERIPLSNDMAVAMFYDYGTKALTPDLIFYYKAAGGGA